MVEQYVRRCRCRRGWRKPAYYQKMKKSLLVWRRRGTCGQKLAPIAVSGHADGKNYGEFFCGRSV